MMVNVTREALEAAFKDSDALKASASNIAKDIAGRTYDISELVDLLGFSLASPTVDMRVKGTRFLSCTLAALPKNIFNSKQLSFLCAFYGDRLKDHHDVMPTVIEGIDVLIRMENLPKGSVPKLLNNFFQHTTCQTQMRGDREKIFKIFHYISDQYVEELKALGSDYIAQIILAIDGERDPRNLDYIFTFMPGVITSYPLLHLNEEMFEVFACYFPVDFTPSPSDPGSITREGLSRKLIGCLVASSEFSEWTITLALEKLASDLNTAKLDSLELLRQSALKFPAAALGTHFNNIWRSLKTILFNGGSRVGIGGGNKCSNNCDDIVMVALKVLRSILVGAAVADSSLSHNYQTTILGEILPHLNDVHHKLFEPSTRVALSCVAADAPFCLEKVLHCFLLKLQSADPSQTLKDEERTRIYAALTKTFKVSYACNATMFKELERNAICLRIQTNLLDTICDGQQVQAIRNHALEALSECVTAINVDHREKLYKIIVHVMTTVEADVDLDFRPILEELSKFFPDELLANCIEVLVRNFAICPDYAKQRIYTNLLPLVKQQSLAKRIIEHIVSNAFCISATPEGCYLALEALHTLVNEENGRFVEALQHKESLIEKLIALMKNGDTNVKVLELASLTMTSVIRQLSLAEQHAIVSEHLPQLRPLLLESHLYVAKGVLGFLHKDIKVDEYFGWLLNDLIEVATQSDNAQLRLVAQHLICSLANKVEYSEHNRDNIRQAIVKLRTGVIVGKEMAVITLSWLSKGLVIRDCVDAPEVIESLIELLDHPEFGGVAQLAFKILAMECPHLHLPLVAPLFRQKFFNLLMSKFGQGLESFGEHHLNSVVYILQTTPHIILKMNQEKVGLMLFKCLRSTQVHTLCISLQIIRNFVHNRDEYFGRHLKNIADLCLQLSHYEESMKVRIDALMVLNDMTHYPAYLLLPLKMDIILQLMHALDDRKRLVRNVAVMTSNAWYLLGETPAKQR